MQRHCGQRFALPLVLLAGLMLPASAVAGGNAHHKAKPARTLASQAPNCTTNCAGLPLDFLAPNDCTGEFVEIFGVFHLVATTSTSGGTLTLTVNTNYQNSSGVALVTGTKYQANNTDHQYERLNPLGVAVDERFDDNYELISLSPTPNMIVHFAFHVHVDEFGVPTVGVDRVDANCQGAGGTTPLV
jgi:hypothetical protein